MSQHLHPHLLQHRRRPHGVHGWQRGQAKVLLLQRGAAAKDLLPLARARFAQRLRLRAPSLRPRQRRSARTPLPPAPLEIVAESRPLQAACEDVGEATACLALPGLTNSSLLWRTTRESVVDTCRNRTVAQDDIHQAAGK